jgi:DNA-binding LacI/PurR family transcriptional regulator
MKIDETNPQHLYIQVVEAIKEQITTGKFRVGDRLPSQKMLADEFSVSLITIKKAMADLSRAGVIFSRTGKGSFVSKTSVHVDFSQSKSIGFILQEIDSPFFSRIVASAEKHLSLLHYNLLLTSTSGEKDREENMIQHMLGIGVSGLIIASMSREYRASTLIRQLHEQKFPYVVVSYLVDEDISYVGVDHERGAFIATEHLIKLGYSKIGYLNGIRGEQGSLLGNLRKRGYLAALAHHNIAYNPDYEYLFQLRGEWNDYQSGYDIGLQFVQSFTRPEAVFAFDDLSALGFEKAVLDKGFRVPQDVAIVGFDNIKRGVTAPVPLTTIHQPTDEIGKLAVDLIYRKITGQPYESRILLTPSLVVRDSCGEFFRNAIAAERISAQKSG